MPTKFNSFVVLHQMLQSLISLTNYKPVLVKLILLHVAALL